MDIKQCFLTNNDCYKAAGNITPNGIIVHSTGCNNPNLRRYVQPDDGILGKNPNGNDWNRAMAKGDRKCVHAFIGKDKNGTVRVYQTLPWNYKCWGCGSGSKGSYNGSYIQLEICEDALNDSTYFTAAFKMAADLCRYLMDKYNIPVENVISHKEAAARGYASSHVDPEHWLAKFGKDMKWFRNQLTVKVINEEATGVLKPTTKHEPLDKLSQPYKVRITATALYIRSGPGTGYKDVGLLTDDKAMIKKNPSYYFPKGVYTISETKNGWGRLKSGVGWIYLDYTKKV
nr:MAG TPA: PGRP protein [Caudoviricetes sp.]